MLPDWDPAALLHEVLVTPRRAFVPLPDLRLIERPGWLQLITPSFKKGGFNEVALAVLAEDEADGVIDATMAEYRHLGLRFRWSVTPDCQPGDLAERLVRRGLACTQVHGMARATSALALLENEQISVEEVDERRLDVYTAVMAEGWDNDRAALDTAHAAIFSQRERSQRLYLASYKGEPAGVASYVAFPRSAYLLGAVVLPRYRQRGLYQALVAARLRDAAARGLVLATSHAQAQTSAPLLLRLGFQKLCSFPVFHG